MNLPYSFRHINIGNNVYRANLFSIEDVEKWIEEYRLITHTTWNVKYHVPKGVKHICRKTIVCKYSNYGKTKGTANKSKMSGCTATIDINIKLSTRTTQIRDKYVKEGLQAVITFKGTHNHPTDIVWAKTSQRPLKGIKSKFFKYFKDGLGITAAIKAHEKSLKCDTLELDTSDATIFPRYRTVCSWLKVWKKDQLRVLNSLSEDKNEELDSLDVGNNIEIIDYKFVNYNDSDLINFLNDSYLVDIANSDNFPRNESKENDKSNETNQKLIEIIKHDHLYSLNEMVISDSPPHPNDHYWHKACRFLKDRFNSIEPLSEERFQYIMATFVNSIITAKDSITYGW